MSGSAVIIGAGAFEPESFFMPEGALIIAADGGLAHCERLGLTAALIVGDFDSLGRVPQGENVIITPAEKDDTDMLLAVKLAMERGCRELYLYGGMGGRFEHSLANLQTLSYIAGCGGRGYLIGEDCVSTVIQNSGLSFSGSFSGYISVFAVGDKATGVNLKGLKYPLTDHTLTCDFPLGVSNEFLGAPANVSVAEGRLAVIWHYSSEGRPCFPR